MRYSRAGIVAVLLAVEVFVGGVILWAVRGGHLGLAAQASDVNRMGEQARIDAGASPHVVINDPDHRVIVTSSADGKVHVTDHTHLLGWFIGSHASDAPLHVERTAGGVSISRADAQPHNDVGFIGIDYQHTEVAVPPDSALEIASCGGANVTGVKARDVKISCGDGSLHLTDVQSPSIVAVTGEGSIKASNVRVDGGRLHSGYGSIHLALTGANLTVHAQTGDGSIRIDGARVARDESGAASYHFGTGGGSLEVSTQDGSIHITPNGAL